MPPTAPKSHCVPVKASNPLSVTQGQQVFALGANPAWLAHSATVAQPRAPHPAAVFQSGETRLPPHAATVVQKRNAPFGLPRARVPHPATVSANLTQRACRSWTPGWTTVTDPRGASVQRMVPSMDVKTDDKSSTRTSQATVSTGVIAATAPAVTATSTITTTAATTTAAATTAAASSASGHCSTGSTTASLCSSSSTASSQDGNETQLTYGKENSMYAARFRQLYASMMPKPLSCGRNVATFQLRPKTNGGGDMSGVVYITLPSDRDLNDLVLDQIRGTKTAKGHSEQLILLVIKAGYKDVSLETHYVDWIYTERRMCRTYPDGYADACSQVVAEVSSTQTECDGPPIKVYYTVTEGPGSGKAMYSNIEGVKKFRLDPERELELKRDVKLAARIRAVGEVKLTTLMKEGVHWDKLLRECQRQLEPYYKRYGRASTDTWEELVEMANLLKSPGMDEKKSSKKIESLLKEFTDSIGGNSMTIDDTLDCLQILETLTRCNS